MTCECQHHTDGCESEAVAHFVWSADGFGERTKWLICDGCKVCVRHRYEPPEFTHSPRAECAMDVSLFDPSANTCLVPPAGLADEVSTFLRHPVNTQGHPQAVDA